jgi:flagellar biosynthesis protein
LGDLDFGYPFDELAERVIKTEKERNIPIVEDVFEEILPELYGAVAKVLVYIKTLRT